MFCFLCYDLLCITHRYSALIKCCFRVSENAEVVCRRVPCPRSSPQCQNNSTRSIQWHQVLLPSKGFDAKTPVIAIQSEHFTHGSLFQIVGGNIESAFEIRRVSDQSGDRGDILFFNSLLNYFS